MSRRDLRAAVPAALLAILAGAISPTGQALAHVTLDPDEAPAASYRKLVFRVPHGCGGSPTVRVAVTLPEAVLSARPQPKPGWQVAIDRQPLATPRPGPHGSTLTERVAGIVWSGGELDPSHFDEFAILVRLPEAEAGTVLAFPVIQDCRDGSLRWTGAPPGGGGGGDSAGPAPALRLAPAQQTHKH